MSISTMLECACMLEKLKMAKYIPPFVHKTTPSEEKRIKARKKRKRKSK